METKIKSDFEKIFKDSLSKNELVIIGMAGAIYELQYSSNLKKWDALTKLNMENSTKIYFDNTSQNSSKRFYRLKLSD